MERHTITNNKNVNGVIGEGRWCHHRWRSRGTSLELSENVVSRWRPLENVSGVIGESPSRWRHRQVDSGQCGIRFSVCVVVGVRVQLAVVISYV